MFFAKIPRHASQNAIAEGDFSWTLTLNCEGTEQLRKRYKKSICQKEENFQLYFMRNL